MRLYHFTSRRHLRGIALHGLTVGDVPTDMRKNRGRCGVWLTSALTPNGHGLFGSAADKTAIRLTVEVADDAPVLFRWREWALTNATADTISILQNANGDQDETWFVYFGVLPPSTIVECVNSENGATIHEWPNFEETPLDAPAVPAWRRDAWHKNLLKKVQKALRQT